MSSRRQFDDHEPGDTMRVRVRWAIAVLAAACVLPLGVAPAAVAAAPAWPEPVALDLAPVQLLVSGVSYRESTTSEKAGRVMGDIVEVDLTKPEVRIDLLTAGTVAGRAGVATMATRAGAVAGINGDYFDIGRTNAAAGPAVKDGRPIKNAVPQARRAAPAVPGAEMDYVFSVGTDRVARVDRLTLKAQVSGPKGKLPVVALNQYAVPEGGIGIFNADWGNADRAKTLCGSDADRNAPCAADRVEVVVRDGAVASVGAPGQGAIPDQDTVLVGRDKGAESLRTLAVGQKVQVDYDFTSASGKAPQFAVGGSPILRDGGPTERLDNRYRAPRSAAGASQDGRHIFLLTLDGRQSDSVGATLAELSTLLKELGAYNAVNLDGGGSSTLVVRKAGAAAISIVNDPSDASARLVGNGVGVFVG